MCHNSKGCKRQHLQAAVRMSVQSQTELEVSLLDLEEQMPLAINVHKSVEEASVYVSCGDLEF